MGIEPTRAAPPGLENMRFCAMTDAKCDLRVNFRGMWGHVGKHFSNPVGRDERWRHGHCLQVRDTAKRIK
jgi:hypothetical protein